MMKHVAKNSTPLLSITILAANHAINTGNNNPKPQPGLPKHSIADFMLSSFFCQPSETQELDKVDAL